MAEGRMLKKNISTSKKLALLSSDSARMLWTWILPHTDSEGRFYASPDIVKGKVIPRLKFSLKKIEGCLQEMVKVGLIILYDNDGERYLQFTRFDDFNVINKEREAKPLPAPSKNPNPNPTPDPLRTNSGLTPAESNISKSNINKYFCPNSTEFRLAKLLFDLIRKRKPNFKAKLKAEKAITDLIGKWALHIDRLIKTDERTPEQVEAVINWCQTDDFWKNNILSTGKLRDQIDQLELKMKASEPVDKKILDQAIKELSIIGGKEKIIPWLRKIPPELWFEFKTRYCRAWPKVAYAPFNFSQAEEVVKKEMEENQKKAGGLVASVADKMGSKLEDPRD